MEPRAATFPFSRVWRRFMATLGRARRLLIVAVCLSFAPSLTALAQTSPPAPLPPAAQQALDKGIIAAKVPDYLLAIRFFEEARKLAPQAPVIFLNLGIAESKLAGRELRAIAWFGAYLAASPDAQNAAAVKQQIAVLDVKNQSNISRLIKTVQDTATQTPEYRNPHLIDVVELWVKAGDFTAALKTADLVRNEAGQEYRSIALSRIAEAQAEYGDIGGALKTVGLVQAKKWKSQAQSKIAEAQAKTGSAPIPPAPSVSDWIYRLDDHYADPSLNTPPFLDLAGYLKSLSSRPSLDLSNMPADIKAMYGKRPPPDAPGEIFLKLHVTALKLITAQNIVHQMLKRQATR